MSVQVLVVEDEDSLGILLRYNLEAAGYLVELVTRGDEVEDHLRDTVPDLILLDWMLPGLSGIEILRRLRARKATERVPVIMLTARGEEGERVRGLNQGADVYVVKPFSIPELMARVSSLLRRANPTRVSHQLEAGPLSLNRETHRVFKSGRELHIGPTEFRLLEYLMQSPGRVYSRAQLLDGVWGRDAFVDERTVDVHVGRLRKSLEMTGPDNPIRTVRGAGYAFDEQFGRAEAS